MQKKYDVAALGELLIDFAPGGVSATGSALYECNPGGAPANVLAAVAKQGGAAAFIGKVGEDAFGRLLRETLEACHIEARGLLSDPEVRTTLAFVSLDESGNRSFSFFRNPGADFMLRADEVDEELIRQARIFHFGSLSLTHEPARSATRHAIGIARGSGCLVSYDPNLRPPLWKSLADAREQIVSCLPLADVVKVSDEEFTFLTGEEDFQRHAPAFVREYGIACLFVTLGPRGCYYLCNGEAGLHPAYNVPVADTTGSGDAFMGAVLGRLSRRTGGLAGLGGGELREIVAYANASGSLTARKKGAIPSIPTDREILNCMATVPLLYMS